LQKEVLKVAFFSAGRLHVTVACDTTVHTRVSNSAYEKTLAGQDSDDRDVSDGGEDNHLMQCPHIPDIVRYHGRNPMDKVGVEEAYPRDSLNVGVGE
jgi:hypothetical protein